RGAKGYNPAPMIPILDCPIWLTETDRYIHHTPKLITGGLVGTGGTFNPILRDRLGQAEPHQGKTEDDDPDKRHPLIDGDQAEDRQPDNEAYPHKRASFSRVEDAERGRVLVTVAMPTRIRPDGCPSPGPGSRPRSALLRVLLR